MERKNDKKKFNVVLFINQNFCTLEISTILVWYTSNMKQRYETYISVGTICKFQINSLCQSFSVELEKPNRSRIFIWGRVEIFFFLLHEFCSQKEIFACYITDYCCCNKFRTMIFKVKSVVLDFFVHFFLPLEFRLSISSILGI